MVKTRKLIINNENRCTVRKPKVRGIRKEKVMRREGDERCRNSSKKKKKEDETN